MTAEIVPDYRQLAQRLESARAAGRTIGLANGCFDFLHVGHVRMLRAGHEHCDLLVVALNSDESVRANKGEGRPFVPLEERMEVMAALGGVRFVTSFDEPTAHSLIEAIRPDVHVKGTDWKAEDVPEREVVERHGGRVLIAGDEKTRSSTELIARARGDARPGE